MIKLWKKARPDRLVRSEEDELLRMVLRFLILSLQLTVGMLASILTITSELPPEGEIVMPDVKSQKLVRITNIENMVKEGALISSMIYISFTALFEPII